MLRNTLKRMFLKLNVSSRVEMVAQLQMRLTLTQFPSPVRQALSPKRTSTEKMIPASLSCDNDEFSQLR